MSTGVPLRYPLIQPGTAAIGRAVRSVTWEDAAAAAAHALGRGAQLVPHHAGRNITLTSGNTYTYAYRTKPRYQALCRLWQVHARAATAGVVTYTIQAPVGGTSVTATASDSVRVTTPAFYREDLSSQSDARTTLTIDITPTDGSLYIDGISCVEVPRLSLSPSVAADLGFDRVLTFPGEPIYADNAGADKGIARLSNALDAEPDIGRRVTHASWAVPYRVNGTDSNTFALSTASGTPSNLFQLGVPCLARPTAIVQSTGALTAARALTVFILARCSDGTTSGVVNLSAVSGDTGTISIPTSTTSFTWFEDVLDVDTEDQNVADGRRSTRWDDVSFTWNRTAGSGTVYVAGMNIVEE